MELGGQRGERGALGRLPCKDAVPAGCAIGCGVVRGWLVISVVVKADHLRQGNEVISALEILS